jgi:hypothetical protein
LMMLSVTNPYLDRGDVGLSADPPHVSSFAQERTTGRRLELEMRGRKWARVAAWLVWRSLW